jgi:hypothetical protein
MEGVYFKQLCTAIHTNNVANVRVLSDSPHFVKAMSCMTKYHQYPIWLIKMEDSSFEPKMLDLFIYKGISLNYNNEHDQTLLHYSIECGYTRLFQYLMKHEELIDINVKDACDMTPLHYACYNLHYKMIKELVVNDADINEVDNCGFTPGMYLFYSTPQHLENPDTIREMCIGILLACTDLDKDYTHSYGESLKSLCLKYSENNNSYLFMNKNRKRTISSN